MSIRMLIDASHQEETRVAIVDGNQVEDFDYESSSKKQLKGSIYLAKVTRVEPSLQAAFVDYGGNRHGFLAFSEIHPDYYQIPVADREALIAEEAAANADLLEDEDAKEEEPAPKKRPRRRTRKKKPESEEASSEQSTEDTDADTDEASKSDSEEKTEAKSAKKSDSDDNSAAAETEAAAKEVKKPRRRKPTTKAQATKTDEAIVGEISDNDEDTSGEEASSEANATDDSGDDESKDSDTNKNTSGSNSNSDTDEDEEERLRIRMAKRLRYKYKIQEVIKKNQIILIQVVKEERGNKGAALTTYLSLPGRYCVLMPNTLHGGGVSRKIANVKDRKKLKNILSELDMPKGHACIIRTAGSDRTKADIKRDYDYLKRMWEAIREHTLKSIAPSLIYEEGNLIKRSIRDLYTRDVNEILVEGEKGYNTARDFMQMLLPSHVKKIKNYEDPIPLFQRYKVENHLDSMYSPTAQLKSGGYIVINPTEALVSIDVNSGRATKEHNIEETAVKTNLEAAEEVARQLKLRDMAGLVVIDFIDMEDNRNNRAVERKMKACLKSDRARIQVGRISSFGLMEMSRQRLRVGVLESSTTACPHCEGSGLLRSVESQSLHILRIIEEEGMRAKNSQFTLYLPSTVAVYILNNKRHSLIDLEKRYDFNVTISIDNDLTASAHRMEKSGKPSKTSQKRKDSLALGNEIKKSTDSAESNASSADENKENPRRRRRRRRGQQNRNNNNNNNNPEQSQASENNETDKTDDNRDNNDRQNPRRRPRRNRRRPKDYNDEEKTEEKLDANVTASEPKEVKTEDKPEEKQAVKPRRPRRQKATPSSEKSDKNQEGNDAGDDKKENNSKPTRRPRSAKKTVEETKEETKSDDNSEEKTKKPVRKRAPKKDAPTEVASAAPAPAPEAKAEPAKPKKKGWWSR